MKMVARSKKELSVEERNLLSVAYKNVIGAKRASWRVLSSIESKEGEKASATESKVDTIVAYKQRVESELDTVCEEILEIIKENLIGTALTAESKVFYHKMSGDYYRYLAEFKVDKPRDEAAASAKKAYLQAQTAAEDSENGLPPTHPIRLGLALNLSVFYYEILGLQSEACELAKKAFDSAIAELDQLQEDSYKDATLIMQLLRDNLTLWTSDGEEKE
eukprot:CAMPEP_0118803830 /NCGR_PEP_ID=MMETSP1161-20130426/19534_1 /TAXON_ID=249345 /ORGANISM="Picochlorum oklahomensis, Strain CCMP2329" /LENGTH=218 /DNA_ID=CAMNT_0006732423 /DNA_START=11 /DNA_END=667 /DNA_ORIENTATION=+